MWTTTEKVQAIADFAGFEPEKDLAQMNEAVMAVYRGRDGRTGSMTMKDFVCDKLSLVINGHSE